MTERRSAGPDRATVLLLSVAAFLAVVAMLANQLRAEATGAPRRPVVVIRRVYETRVVETVPAGSPSGSSVTQSTSNSTPVSATAAPTTRSS